MTARDFRASIDWSAPWLAPYRAGAAPFLESEDWRKAATIAASAAGLRNHRGQPVVFVPQEALPSGTAYEAFIGATGQVPSRDNLHDFFNALMWLHFPRTKVRLNALQAEAIAKNGGIKPFRGKLRDAATIFDENAVIVPYSDPEIADALRAHDWKRVFVERLCGLGREWAPWIFGHAMLEKLVNPYKAATGHAWLIRVESGFFDSPEVMRREWLDRAISLEVTADLSTAAFTPLPVSGVPGWWDGQDDAFYADATVFRPPRARQP